MGGFLRFIGYTLAFCGLVAALRQSGWRFVYIYSRRQGVTVLAVGAVLLAAGLLWPAKPAPVPTPVSAPESEKGEPWSYEEEGRRYPGRQVNSVGVALVDWKQQPEVGGTRARGQFLLIQLAIHNQQPEVVTFDGMTHAKLLDKTGDRSSASTAGLIGLQVAGLEAFRNSRIETGATLKGWMIFDVPAEADPADLQLEFYITNVADTARIPLKALDGG